MCVFVCRSSPKEEVIPLQRQRISSFRLSEKKRPLDPVQNFRLNKHTEGKIRIGVVLAGVGVI